MKDKKIEPELTPQRPETTLMLARFTMWCLDKMFDRLRRKYTDETTINALNEAQEGSNIIFSILFRTRR